MVPRLRGRTTLLTCLVLLTVASLQGWGCQSSSDDWQAIEFEQAGLTFSLPSNWSASRRIGVRAPKPLKQDQPSGDSPDSKNDLPFEDASILTALPVIEDAAIVVIAPRLNLPEETFAKEIHNFIPLTEVKFTHEREPWAMNKKSGLVGLAFEGTGKLSSKEGSAIYFRSVVISVSGKPVIITLYAEHERKDIYETLFTQILTSFVPMVPEKAALPPKETPPTEAKPEKTAESPTTPVLVPTPTPTDPEPDTPAVAPDPVAPSEPAKTAESEPSTAEEVPDSGVPPSTDSDLPDDGIYRLPMDKPLGETPPITPAPAP